VPFFADVPVRVGYAGEARVGLIDVRHANPKKNAAREPMAQFYARLADLPGKPVPELSAPMLLADPLRVIAAKVNLGLKPLDNLVALCPGAEYGPAKRWPAEYFAEAASKLKARGYLPIVLGAQGDVPTGLTIEQLSSGAAINLCGKTSLDDAINLIAGSRAVITNDSGLMHVAAALGIPQLALFGSSSPEHTPPLSELARVIYLKAECSPCFARECPLGHFKCMREMTPERVMTEFDAMSDLLTSR
jgi:heptosyltransferase-2